MRTSDIALTAIHPIHQQSETHGRWGEREREGEWRSERASERVEIEEKKKQRVFLNFHDMVVHSSYTLRVASVQYRPDSLLGLC